MLQHARTRTHRWLSAFGFSGPQYMQPATEPCLVGRDWPHQRGGRGSGKRRRRSRGMKGRFGEVCPRNRQIVVLTVIAMLAVTLIRGWFLR